MISVFRFQDLKMSFSQLGKNSASMCCMQVINTVFFTYGVLLGCKLSLVNSGSNFPFKRFLFLLDNFFN